MYFDHKIFGLTPSFTSILTANTQGWRESRGRNNIEHGHLMEKGEGNKRKEGTLEKNNAGKDL